MGFMRLVTWLVTNAIALAVAAWLFEGIWFSGPTQGQAEIEEKLLPLLVVALILGVVTAIVKPVLTLLTLPVVVLTIGLFLVVINAFMLQLTAWLSGKLDLGFHVDGFLTAVGGSLFEPGSQSFEFPTLLADGDTVALEWRVRARTPGGADYHNAYCGVFVIRDGRIATVREYLDTQYAAQAGVVEPGLQHHVRHR